MAAVTLVNIAPSIAQPSRPVQFSLVSLSDPGNDDASARDYMLVASGRHDHSSTPADGRNCVPSIQQSCDIYEIQTALPHCGKYASYFVGSRVVSDPALHITTRVDPLFFALAHLQRAGRSASVAERLGKWQPWDQTLGDLPSPVLRALGLDPNRSLDGIHGMGQLGHLLDASDMCGDDLILSRFSEERALKWLVAKFDSAVEALHQRFREKKRRAAERSEELKSMSGGSGAFSSSFIVAEDEELTTAAPATYEKRNKHEATNSVLSKVEERSLRVGALQLICNYVPTEWKGKLTKEVGLSKGDWMIKKNSKSDAAKDGIGINIAGEKRSRASWKEMAGQADADALMHFASGGSIGGSKGAVITPGGKKDIRNAQSAGLKKLAKENTKGMKSLASFFGASKKKKTK